MFERFSDAARRVVVLAQEEARLVPHDYIGTEHLLLALARIDGGVVFDTFRFFELTRDGVRVRVEEIAPGGVEPSGHVPFTPRAKKALELSLREALALGDGGIGPEHILLGVLDEGTGVAVRALQAAGADPAAVRDKVLELRDARSDAGDAITRAEPELSPTPPTVRGEAVALMGAWGGPGARPVPRCAFCGRDAERCEHVLIAGGVRLCDECVRDAVAQLDALPADAPKLVRYRRREYAPSDRDAAVRAIERAFDAVTGPMQLEIDQALAFTEGGEECREFLAVVHAVKDRVPVVVNDQTVERVRFLSETEAEVSVGIWFAGNPQPMIQPGHAVFDDGTWKVSRSSLRHYAQQARPFLPPRAL